MRLRTLLLVFTVFAGGMSSVGAKESLKPFTTDGCSLFPDGSPENKHLWLQCCLEHDRSYWLGGTRDERRAADKQLKQCVVGLDEKFVAGVMQTGVRLGGTPWLPTSFRWGYGWPFGRGYQAISEAEERLALKLMAPVAVEPLTRPTSWALPITLAGAPNLHKVSDNLYRSAQPSAEGMANLSALGIKSVISLRAFHSDREALGSTGLVYERIPIKTWHPEREDVVRFLKIATSPARVPVLVHCQHGADRTGTLVTIYRVAVEGWSKAEAVREMTEGGFGFHEIWVNLVPWLEELDMESIRREVGLTQSVTVVPKQK